MRGQNLIVPYRQIKKTRITNVHVYIYIVYLYSFERCHEVALIGQTKEEKKQSNLLCVFV